MPVLDDPRQEKFIQLVFDNWSQRGAYREAFPLSRKWKDTTVDPKASALFNSDKVQARLNELKEQARALYEQQAREKVLTVVDRMVLLSHIARDSESDKARISAVDTLNKMDGLYTQKVEVSGLAAEQSKLSELLEQRRAKRGEA